MKKFIFAAAAVMAFAGASAKSNDPDKNTLYGKYRAGTEISDHYQNGEIGCIRHDMLLTENRWKIKNRQNKQIWSAAGRNTVVKMKENDYKEFAKARVDGEKCYLKDIDPAKTKKHVAKIRQDGKKHSMRNVAAENGRQIISAK